MKQSVCVVCLLACMPLCGAVLWYQPVAAGSAYTNQEFPDSPTYSNYAVSNIVVPAGGWTITDGTWYMVEWNGDGYDGTTIDVVFNVFPLSGSLPTAADDPTTSSVLSASYSVSGSDVIIQLSGLNLYLDAGSYWIGITPIMNYSPYGQIGFHVSDAVYGVLDAWINPGDGFGRGTEWQTIGAIGATTDVAFKLEGVPGGEVPEPSTWMLGATGLGLLAWLRRRR